MSASIDLQDVPETMLWPLWNRAAEQQRSDRLIEDPLSAELVERLDYPFAANFGKPNPGHPIRARLIDDAIKDWLVTHPRGTIVALGEGLESQFWRVDNGTMNWFSVDLPVAIEVRHRFLPQDERMRSIACSALDHAWMDEVPQGEPLFISMAGLLMYFTEEQVAELLRGIATRFADSEMYFDAIPMWMSKKTIKGHNVNKNYRMPLCPWGLNFKDHKQVLSWHPALRIKRIVTYADDFPARMRPWSWLARVPMLRNKMAPWLMHLHVDPNAA